MLIQALGQRKLFVTECTGMRQLSDVNNLDVTPESGVLVEFSAALWAGDDDTGCGEVLVNPHVQAFAYNASTRRWRSVMAPSFQRWLWRGSGQSS